LPSSDVLQDARLVSDPIAVRLAPPLVDAAGAVRAAEAEREALRAEAYAAGHAAGETQGVAREHERLAQVWQGLTAAQAALETQRQALVAPLREDLVRLVLAMTEKLARRAVELDPQATERSVEAALAAVGAACTVEVRLHPEDCELFAEQRERWRQGPPEREALTLIADASVGRGGCRVATEALTIDATFEGLLERFAAGLIEWARTGHESQEAQDAA
jgi:flagellar assembly protein FliH